MAHIEIELQSLIDKGKVSKNQICYFCKMERTQLNKYCRNEISRFDLTILARLCNYLKCTPNDILVLREDPEDETASPD